MPGHPCLRGWSAAPLEGPCEQAGSRARGRPRPPRSLSKQVPGGVWRWLRHPPRQGHLGGQAPPSCPGHSRVARSSVRSLRAAGSLLRALPGRGGGRRGRAGSAPSAGGRPSSSPRYRPRMAARQPVGPPQPLALEGCAACAGTTRWEGDKGPSGEPQGPASGPLLSGLASASCRARPGRHSGRGPAPGRSAESRACPAGRWPHLGRRGPRLRQPGPAGAQAGGRPRPCG